MLYKSQDYALAFNDNAAEIPEDLWRGTELEAYFDLPVSHPRRSALASVQAKPAAEREEP